MEAQLFSALSCDMLLAARHRVRTWRAPLPAPRRCPPPPPPPAAVMTGTPIQNHMGELFALLHWLNRDAFPSEAAFMAEFGNLAAAPEEARARLTALLRPHILRRTKEDVLRSLPARHEVLVPVPLAAAQVEMYRMTLTRSYELVRRARGGSSIAMAV